MSAISEANSTAASDEAAREIVITRTFDAPREMVFDAWTDPRHIGAWWGPTGFTTTTHEMDVRPGGKWRFIMHGPDGTDYDNVILYREVVRPERLVYLQADREDAPNPFHVTVTFDEDGGKTRVRLRMLFATAADRDYVVEKHHAIEGGNQTLARLAEYVGKQNVRLTFTRTFDAPRELVFRAWTDPEQIARWWGPQHFTNEVRAFEPRPGGAMRIDMIGPDGTVYPGDGTFLEVIENERLVFTGQALDAEGNVVLEDHSTVTFEDDGGRTRMTLEARVVRAYGVGIDYIRGMEEGWSQSLERLGVAIDPHTFVLARTFDAPRELVFRAFTERDHLLRWWGPKAFEVTSCTVDLRPGGVMHYGMRGPNDMNIWGRWVFREIAAPRQLTFVASFSDAQGGVTRAPFFDGRYPLEALTTMVFEEHQGRTTVTLYTVPINATESERELFLSIHPSMQQGWGGTFDKLAEYIPSAS